ncbi:MAG TPA: VOC family protein [Jatrophihabitans sp.]|nr:VOC family protein [Jatrophihabitans sp.]
MHDPFSDLRAPATPARPDPEFADRLRAQLERALARPRGVVAVTTITESQTEAAAPAGAAVPYLAVADARRALEWYAEIFGAQLVGDPIVMPDGRVGHAELALAGGTLYLADQHPELGVVAPSPGAASVSLMLRVDDADATRARALAAGATGDREPYDGYGSRNAWIVDPFGHRWGLNSPLASGSGRYQPGDIGYVSLWVPDAARAARFYANVLGWRMAGDLVAGTTPTTGIVGTDEDPTLLCGYVVEDVDAAAQRVREAGGTASEPSERPHGVVADCTDDQGARFAIYQPPSAADGLRPPANGRRPGDLSYLTLEVVDSARARAFYAAVLGWRFTPGRVVDGWNVEDTTPMIGLSGGHERASAVPMWRVGDIERAVAAVRAGGGTATDPVRQPYGLTSECADDDGMRFHLGEL